MARPLDQHWHGAFRDWVTPTRGRHAPASSYHTRSVTVTAATFWVIVSAATPPGRIGNWGLQTHEAITTPRQLNRAIEQNEASRCSNEHRPCGALRSPGGGGWASQLTTGCCVERAYKRRLRLSGKVTVQSVT